MYRVIICLGWSVLITSVLTIAVFVFDAPSILLWQVRLIAPPGTTLTIFTVPIGILLGIPIYAVVSYIVWRVKGSLENGERFR